WPGGLRAHAKWHNVRHHAGHLRHPRGAPNSHGHQHPRGVEALYAGEVRHLYSIRQLIVVAPASGSVGAHDLLDRPERCTSLCTTTLYLLNKQSFYYLNNTNDAMQYNLQ